MKLISILTLLLSIIILNDIKAQVTDDEIGYHFDMDRHCTEGYLYMHEYKPTNIISGTYYVEFEFTPGKFYDISGNYRDGRVKYLGIENQFEFIYNEDSTETEVIITPEQCSAFTVGLDSFITVNKYTTTSNSVTFSKRFAEVLCEIDGLTFYKQVYYNRLLDKAITTYLIKTKEGEVIRIPKMGYKLRNTLNTYFGEVEMIQRFLDENLVQNSDFENLLSIFDYYTKFKNNEYIYYDQSWKKLKSSKNADYFVSVNFNIENNIQLKYHHINGDIISEGNYNSLIPLVKNGAQKSYYPNGKLHKQEEFLEDKRINTSISYYKSGEIHTISDYKNNYELILEVLDIFGKPLLDEKGSGIEELYDTYLERTLYKEYKKGVLKSVYYINNNSRVYLLASKKLKLDDYAFDYSKFYEHKEYPKSELANSNGWTCLVRFTINEDGRFLDYEMISKPNKNFDAYTIDFINTLESNPLFARPKHKRKKVSQEVIIPFVFAIENSLKYELKNLFNRGWLEVSTLQTKIILNELILEREVKPPKDHFN